MELHECLEKVANNRPNNNPNLLERISGQAKQMGARVGDQFMKQAPLMLGGLAASTAVNKGVQLAGSLLDGSDKKSEQYWMKFTEKYPEYNGDEKAKEFFNVLMDSNPSMAKHPVMVKSFLKTTYDHADAINPETVRTLSSVEKNMTDFQDTKAKPGREINKGMQNIIQNINEKANEDVSMDNLNKSKMVADLVRQGHTPDAVQHGLMTGDPEPMAREAWNMR